MADLWSYIGFNVTFTAIWFVGSPQGEFWPKWTLLWWGVFLPWHAISDLPTQGPEFEKKLAVWHARQQRKAAKRAAKQIRPSEQDDAAAE